jgi:hypothetical protein
MNYDYDKIWEAKRQHICSCSQPFLKVFDGSKFFYQSGITHDFCIFYHERQLQFEIAVFDPKENVEQKRLYIGSAVIFDIIAGNVKKAHKQAMTPEIMLEMAADTIMKRLSLKYGKVYFHLLPGDIMVKQFLLDSPCAPGIAHIVIKWNVGSNFSRYHDISN